MPALFFHPSFFSSYWGFLLEIFLGISLINAVLHFLHGLKRKGCAFSSILRIYHATYWIQFVAWTSLGESLSIRCWPFVLIILACIPSEVTWVFHLSSQFGTFGGTMISETLFDIYGNYHLTFQIMGICIILGRLLFFFASKSNFQYFLVKASIKNCVTEKN